MCRVCYLWSFSVIQWLQLVACLCSMTCAWHLYSTVTLLCNEVEGVETDCLSRYYALWVRVPNTTNSYQHLYATDPLITNVSIFSMYTWGNFICPRLQEIFHESYSYFQDFLSRMRKCKITKWFPTPFPKGHLLSFQSRLIKDETY